MSAHTGGVGVLCVEDNRHVADALRIKISGARGYVWKGWLPDADNLLPAVRALRPAVVLLDIDMPGRDPFDAMRELADACPESRPLILSGHVRRDLIDRALQAGAWGYVSKNDDEDEILNAIDRVAAGEIALSPEVDQVYRRAE